MSEPAKMDPAKADQERLAHALVSRGLITREEAQQCRAGTHSPQALLERLVEAGFVTATQSQRVAQEMTLWLGQQIPGYQLLEKLGQGTSGVVYKARQLSMNRLVAIKILHPRLAGNPQFLKRLTREAHLAAKLSHNNIISAIDVGSAGDLHYFVMEYVEGTTLKQELEAGKRYGEKEAVEIVLQIAQALDHGHRRGLIHRDIKPANIVLTPEGIAKLADLGMARDVGDERMIRAERGVTMGTPYYISPEQIRAREDIDVRSDIYSLGATFYHLVTGQVPFAAANTDDVLEAHLKQELTPPDHLNTDLSAGLGEVVEFMMAKDRRQRYPTPEGLIIDLECLLNGEAPKIARQKMQAATFEDLAEGEEDEEDGGQVGGPAHAVIWLTVLGAALGVSLLLNLIQLIRR
jgi:serine/threonine-protein kinase